MMEGSDNRILRRVECLILCLIFILVESASAQEGFVSIKCCADSNTPDKNTNITWISDYKWYPDATSCRSFIRPEVNYTGYNRSRVFDINSGKRCYNLATNKDQQYLIRGTFLFGDALGIRSPTGNSFSVSIGVTQIGEVKLEEEEAELEGVFRANNNHYINYCLLAPGYPYISKLELRPLDGVGYLNWGSSSVLKLVNRSDVGGSGEGIRYPYDRSDRIWTPTSSPELRTLSNTHIPFSNPTSTVPLQVLQTALTHSDKLEFMHNGLDAGDFNYTIFLYFLELNDTVKSGQRVFDIYINNVKKSENFDVLDGGSIYKEAALNATANGSLNLTLVKVPNGFEFGPICNAYEIFQVRPWIQETNQEDVNVIMEVKNELLIDNQDSEIRESWSGDPCLPHPWKGLDCDSINGSVVITKLDLSSSKLQGMLPPSITKLTYLKDLNLSYNDFTGNFPLFPDSSMLISVDMSHNDLTGLNLESLTALSRLKILNISCNQHFNKELPANSSKFTTDYETCDGQEGSRSTHKILISTVACGSFLFMVAVGIVSVFFYRRKLMDRGKFDRKGYPMIKNAVFAIPSMDDFVVKSISIQQFTLQYVESATENYKTLIGEGGFGSVYRGTLLDGQDVAVKVRSATSTQGRREFENELNLLSAIRYENLVPLLGYCCENDQQILVYPFMSNGSLQDRLYGEAAKRKILDWPTRLSIALGSARGLTYLHSFAGRCVIHRDVKSSNILLDHSMCAKVADFGFSKYAPQEGDSGASLEVRGTAGYLDPEYYSTQHLSAKSDVFSFGVVLLEIISGREPLNIHRPRNEWSLVEWAKPYIRESKIDEIVDPSIKGGYHAEAMWRVVEVALACIEPFSAYRPCMADIVRELEDALIIENNASEYMRSIDSLGGYSLGGSNRFSMVNVDKKIVLSPPPPTPPEPSPMNTQALAPPEPR